ncbi:hypothetical protein C8Q76DRAFT_695931 [Earliella scabrosa]|nr:hypothetical protein C8Q76DRAFT_695931 [Earliella scabrosa]
MASAQANKKKALLSQYLKDARNNYEVEWDSMSALTEPPQDASNTHSWSSLSSAERMRQLTAGFDRLAVKNVEIARLPQNTSTFPEFSLAQAVKRNYPKGTHTAEGVNLDDEPSTVWKGDHARRGVDKDGWALAYHFPQAFRGESLRAATAAIERWGHSTTPDTKGSNDFPNCYKPGDLAGRTRVASLWHAIGRSTSKLRTHYRTLPQSKKYLTIYQPWNRSTISPPWSHLELSLAWGLSQRTRRARPVPSIRRQSRTLAVTHTFAGQHAFSARGSGGVGSTHRTRLGNLCHATLTQLGRMNGRTVTSLVDVLIEVHHPDTGVVEESSMHSGRGSRNTCCPS